MDWTNTKEDAAGIEEQIQIRKMLAERPWLANQTGAFVGGLASILPQLGDNTAQQERLASNYRSEAPTSYRLGAYGLPTAMTAGSAAAGYLPGVALGGAMLTSAASKDPTLADMLKRFKP